MGQWEKEWYKPMATDLERDFLQYKRQLIRMSFGRLNQPQFEAVTHIPVSYTHLDVYKRQVCGADGRGH